MRLMNLGYGAHGFVDEGGVEGGGTEEYLPLQRHCLNLAPFVLLNSVAKHQSRRTAVFHCRENYERSGVSSACLTSQRLSNASLASFVLPVCSISLMQRPKRTCNFSKSFNCHCGDIFPYIFFISYNWHLGQYHSY